VKEQEENMEEEEGRRGIPSLLKPPLPPETEAGSLQQEHIASDITQVRSSLVSISRHMFLFLPLPLQLVSLISFSCRTTMHKFPQKKNYHVQVACLFSACRMDTTDRSEKNHPEG
jgi:hypothetical protein